MKVYNPPMNVPEDVFRAYNSVFLAGSIENGVAENWQHRAEQLFSDFNVNILNPRRDNWDPTWVQDISNKPFTEQVLWELDGLTHCANVLMYFDPNTKSPITLLEFGLMAASKSTKTHIICPKGFWKKGNIDVVCKKYHITMYSTLEDAVDAIKKDIERVYYE